jgi:heat shock protein HtpX
VLVDRVARANRLRIVTIAMVAALNFWGVVTVLLILVGWIVTAPVAIRLELEAPPTVVIAVAGMAMSAVITAVWTAMRLSTIRRRTLRSIGATEIKPGDLPRVENLLAELAIAAGTPAVNAALVADSAPNALGVGGRPGRTTIVVTRGLVERLTRDELEAVLAAEMCAVRRLDTALRSVASACCSDAILVHNLFRQEVGPDKPWYYRLDWSVWALALVTWPTMTCAAVLRRSVLRSSDFGADAMAVAITRHPDAMLSALRKLRDDAGVVAVYADQFGLIADAPRVGPEWFEPIPEQPNVTPREVHQMALMPTLDERLAQLMRVFPGAAPTR